jgi:hypothetical protein
VLPSPDRAERDPGDAGQASELVLGDPSPYALPPDPKTHPAQPLVWAWDIVAGAALQAFARGRSHYLDALGGVRLIDAQ